MTIAPFLDSHFLETSETIAESEIRDLFDLEPEDGQTAPIIGVCDGEWREDGGGLWRFWRFTEAGRLAAGYTITGSAR